MVLTVGLDGVSFQARCNRSLRRSRGLFRWRSGPVCAWSTSARPARCSRREATGAGADKSGFQLGVSGSETSTAPIQRR